MNPILEVEHLLTDDELRLTVAIRAKRPLPASTCSWVETMRSRCINRIIAMVGHGGFQWLLRNRQPSLGGLTGAELLQRDPEELWNRLELLTVDDEAQDDVDPLVLDRPAQRRSSKETSRLLQILDELETKGRAG